MKSINSLRKKKNKNFYLVIKVISEEEVNTQTHIMATSIGTSPHLFVSCFPQSLRFSMVSAVFLRSLMSIGMKAEKLIYLRTHCRYHLI